MLFICIACRLFVSAKYYAHIFIKITHIFAYDFSQSIYISDFYNRSSYRKADRFGRKLEKYHYCQCVCIGIQKLSLLQNQYKQFSTIASNPNGKLQKMLVIRPFQDPTLSVGAKKAVVSSYWTHPTASNCDSMPICLFHKIKALLFNPTS